MPRDDQPVERHPEGCRPPDSPSSYDSGCCAAGHRLDGTFTRHPILIAVSVVITRMQIHRQPTDATRQSGRRCLYPVPAVSRLTVAATPQRRALGRVHSDVGTRGQPPAFALPSNGAILVNWRPSCHVPAAGSVRATTAMQVMPAAAREETAGWLWGVRGGAVRLAGPFLITDS